jgi:hypothetical protein
MSMNNHWTVAAPGNRYNIPSNLDRALWFYGHGYKGIEKFIQ